MLLDLICKKDKEFCQAKDQIRYQISQELRDT